MDRALPFEILVHIADLLDLEATSRLRRCSLRCYKATEHTKWGQAKFFGEPDDPGGVVRRGVVLTLLLTPEFFRQVRVVFCVVDNTVAAMCLVNRRLYRPSCWTTILW